MRKWRQAHRQALVARRGMAPRMWPAAKGPPSQPSGNARLLITTTSCICCYHHRRGQAHPRMRPLLRIPYCIPHRPTPRRYTHQLPTTRAQCFGSHRPARTAGPHRAASSVRWSNGPWQAPAMPPRLGDRPRRTFSRHTCCRHTTALRLTTQDVVQQAGVRRQQAQASGAGVPVGLALLAAALAVSAVGMMAVAVMMVADASTEAEVARLA